MTLEEAKAIKAEGRWGMQGGLLSASEMVELYRLIKEHSFNVLEVGHYMGLSTHVIQKTLINVVTIDAYIVDDWVKDSHEATYAENLKKEHERGLVQSLTMNSNAITSIYGFDTVFYDGDHADEQLRFTKVVNNSPNVDLFIFDDRDFPFPALCCEYLKNHGWQDVSPALARLSGDKMNDATMTLGVFRRAL